MKRLTFLTVAVLLLYGCSKHTSAPPATLITPPPVDRAAAIAGAYVGTFSYDSPGSSSGKDTSYIATAYITEVDTASVKVVFNPANINQIYSVDVIQWNATFVYGIAIKNDTFLLSLVPGSAGSGHSVLSFLGVK